MIMHAYNIYKNLLNVNIYSCSTKRMMKRRPKNPLYSFHGFKIDGTVA